MSSRKNSQGFTLVQVMIAVFLLSIALIPLATVFFASTRNVERGGEILDATIVTQTLMDSVKNDKFLFDHRNATIEIPSDKYPQFVIEKNFMERYKARAKVRIEKAPDHDDPDLLCITVTLYWFEDTVQKETSLVTYMANINDLKYTKIE